MLKNLNDAPSLLQRQKCDHRLDSTGIGWTDGRKELGALLGTLELISLSTIVRWVRGFQQVLY